MPRLQLIFTLVVLVSLVSCKAPSRSELCGRYLAEYKFATEEVIVNCDGSFEQNITLKTTGAKNVGRGSWSYDASDAYILFDGTFFTAQDGFGKFDPQYANQKQGISSFPVGRPFGTIQFGAAEGIIYRKQR